MLLKALEENAEIIEQVVAQLQTKGRKDVVQAATFIRQYYSQVDPEDLAERRISDLCGAARATWDFIRTFQSGTTKVRVYNPESQKDGWESTHTAIEIIQENMPFLLDSVTMEVNRQGLTLHLIIHPVIRTQRDANGLLVEILPNDPCNNPSSESVIHVEVDRQTDPEKLGELEAGLLRILGDVRKAVEDYSKMREKLDRVVTEIRESHPKTLDHEKVEEER